MEAHESHSEERSQEKSVELGGARKQHSDVANEKESEPANDIDSDGCPGRRFRLSRVDLSEKLCAHFGRTANQPQHEKNAEDDPAPAAVA